MKKSIIIMAKVPVAGRVKTRLQPQLTPAGSAALAAAFLHDAVTKAQTVTDEITVAYTPAASKKELESILPHKPFLIEQTGDNLGERIFNAFDHAFREGAAAVVMTGTDSPTFPADHIEQAFEFLEIETDAVLGKTEDGGFYLIGLRRLERGIFENVRWSSPETFEQVWQNIMDAGWHLREVPGWYDVDEPGDLAQLRRELICNKNARRRAPRTFDWIEKNYIPPPTQ